MKFNINLNQPMMIKHNLNVTQWCILDVISVAPIWSEAIVFNNMTYYWIARQKIAEELVALDLKPDTIYRAIKVLVNLGFLNHEKQGKKDLISLTNLGKELFITMSEKNPNHYVGKKSECNSEKNPTYNNTNYNNNTDINYDDFLLIWNEYASKNNKPKVLKLSDVRKRKIAKRLKDFKDFKEALRIALDKASSSTFLKDGSFFSFDWLIENDGNIVKVIEDRYKNKEVSYK